MLGAIFGFDGARLRQPLIGARRMKFWRHLAAVACIGAGLSTPASAATVETFTLVDVTLSSHGTATGSFDFNLDTGALSNVTVTLDDNVSHLFFRGLITFNQAFVDTLPDPGIASVSDTLFSAVPPVFRFEFHPNGLETYVLALSPGETPIQPLSQPLSTANVFPGATFPIWIGFTGAYAASGTTTTPVDGVNEAGGLLLVSAVTPVPVPATLPLFASGLAGLGWLARRRRKSATN